MRYTEPVIGDAHRHGRHARLAACMRAASHGAIAERLRLACAALDQRAPMPLAGLRVVSRYARDGRWRVMGSVYRSPACP